MSEKKGKLRVIKLVPVEWLMEALNAWDNYATDNMNLSMSKRECARIDELRKLSAAPEQPLGDGTSKEILDLLDFAEWGTPEHAEEILLKLIERLRALKFPEQPTELRAEQINWIETLCTTCGKIIMQPAKSTKFVSKSQLRRVAAQKSKATPDYDDSVIKAREHINTPRKGE